MCTIAICPKGARAGDVGLSFERPYLSSISISIPHAAYLVLNPSNGTARKIHQKKHISLMQNKLVDRQTGKLGSTQKVRKVVHGDRAGSLMIGS